MNNGTRIFCIVLCVLLIALSATGVIWALYNKFANNEAYAEYADLNNNSIVNFNQQFNNTLSARSNYNSITISKENYTYSVSGSFTGYNLYLSFTTENVLYVNLISGHKYYIDPKLKVNSGSTPNLILSNGSTHYIQNITNDIYTSNENATAYFGFWHNVAYTYNFNVTPMIIDITAMFGSGNEPNLQEARDYFIADYYMYNTGTTIPFGIDYLTGYQQGIIDFQNSLTATFNNDVLGTLSFAANIAGFESSIGYNAQTSQYLVSGIAGFRLGNAISSPISFHADMFLTNYSGGLYLAFFNYTTAGDLIPLWVGEVQEGDNLHYIDANFNISNIDTLYFGLFDSNVNFNTSTSVSAYFIKTELKIYNIDVASIVNAAIGQTKASYNEGGAEYESIFYQGYLSGVQAQNATLGTMDYIGAAFTGIGSILAIELLPGVPFSLFVLLPLMFGLIAFVVKLSKGGS